MATKGDILFGCAAGAGRSSARTNFYHRAQIVRQNIINPEKRDEFDKWYAEAIKELDEFDEETEVEPDFPTNPETHAP